MLESKWGLRFLAFAFALVFFLSVHNVFGTTFNANKLTQSTSRVISDVPVEVVYDNEKIYVSGVPDTVNVEISGPQSKVLRAEKAENIKATLDLSHAYLGQHRVKFDVKGLEKDVNARVTPKETTVKVQEKISRKFKVEPDVSVNQVDANFKVKSQSLNTDTVKITGGKEQIDNIAFVKATLDTTDPITTDTTNIAKVTAFDKNLNKLDVAINPKDIKLSVKLEQYSKMVDIKTDVVGKPANGKSVDNVELDERKIEIFGNRDDLANIDHVNAEVSVDGLENETEKDVTVKLPEKATGAKPEKVTALIKLK